MPLVEQIEDSGYVFEFIPPIQIPDGIAVEGLFHVLSFSQVVWHRVDPKYARDFEGILYDATTPIKTPEHLADYLSQVEGNPEVRFLGKIR